MKQTPNSVETYRVVVGTTRALVHFERTEEVCECVAEMILARRRRAGLQIPRDIGSRIAAALREGVSFIEDERGLLVAANRRTLHTARPSPAAKPQPGPPKSAPPVEKSRAGKRRRRRAR